MAAKPTSSHPSREHLDTITHMRTIERFPTPWGIAVSNEGHVLVGARGGMTVLDKEGRKIKSFSASGGIKFSYPTGIVITPDNFILFTDNNKIHKISMDGKLIASVGEKGTKPLEFDFPYGIAISPTTGQIYVVDNNNHRIQVLNPDLSFSFSFGCEGSAEGQFLHPAFITIDDQEIVYVSDCGNHRIQKFTADGKFLSTFGTRGSGPGQFRSPSGMAIANNLLYVAEVANHRVSIFSTDGEFIRSFGSYGTNKDQFDSPYGLAFNDEGYLYICEYMNDRVVVYY